MASIFESDFDGMDAELQQFSSFNEETYDPTEQGFDPQGLNLQRRPNGRFQVGAKDLSKMGTLTIKVTQLKDGQRIALGTTARPGISGKPRNRYELFGAIRSISAFQNPNSFGSVSPFSAQMTTRISAIVTKNIITIGQSIQPNTAYDAVFDVAYFTEVGDLFIGKATLGTDSNSDWVMTPRDGVLISCIEKPYRFVLEELKSTLVGIQSYKFAYGIANSLDYSQEFTKESFLGDGRINSVTGRDYFSSNQYQPNQVDMNISTWIYNELALSGDIDLQEPELTFTFKVRSYNKTGLMGNVR